MIDKIIFFIAVGVLVFLVAFAFFTPANAQSPFDIQYPVQELGNCGSQDECKTFCDAPANQEVCLDWAAKNGFIPEREIKRMKDMKNFEEKAVKGEPVEDFGPGGCKTPAECDAFCEAPENLEPCLQYGVEHGYTTAEEADRIREQANKKGPGGCESDRECRTFCDDPGNIEDCMAFAVEEGKISKEDADFIIEQTKKYGGPGGPRGMEGSPGDGRFAEPEGSPVGRRGPEPDIDKEKALKLLESGTGPGECSTVEECGKYCDDPNNIEECMNFAIKNELVPEKEVEMMQKMLVSGGPGGCRGPAECDTFCSQPENMEECFKFAKESGFIPPEEIEAMDREMDIMKKLDRRGGPGGPGSPFGGEMPPPGDFPGRRGDFRGEGEFPPPGEFPGKGEFPDNGRDFPRDFRKGFGQDGPSDYGKRPDGFFEREGGERGGPDGFRDRGNINEDFRGREGGRGGDFGPRKDFGREGENFPPEGENRRDFEGRDFEKFAPSEGGYNRGDYKGRDFPGGAPENMPENIPKDILEKMMKEREGMPPEGGIPSGGFAPRDNEYGGGEFGGPGRTFDGNGNPDGGFVGPGPVFDGGPSGGFVEPGPVPGEEFPPEGEPASGWEENPDGFSEPTSLRGGSLIGAVLGPFLDIFTR
ncbi:MAG: hypothetical protein GXP44_02950 [bacterium]|nr:hypothetical protein [bacterium]